MVSCVVLWELNSDGEPVSLKEHQFTYCPFFSSVVGPTFSVLIVFESGNLYFPPYWVLPSQWLSLPLDSNVFSGTPVQQRTFCRCHRWSSNMTEEGHSKRFCFSGESLDLDGYILNIFLLLDLISPPDITYDTTWRDLEVNPDFQVKVVHFFQNYIIPTLKRDLYLLYFSL